MIQRPTADHYEAASAAPRTQQNAKETAASARVQPPEPRIVSRFADHFKAVSVELFGGMILPLSRFRIWRKLRLDGILTLERG
jgi:hypothetical protein